MTENYAEVAVRVYVFNLRRNYGVSVNIEKKAGWL
jgi:hypothetical protein